MPNRIDFLDVKYLVAKYQTWNTYICFDSSFYLLTEKVMLT